MRRNDLRIGLFESHNHFQSIAYTPRPQIPPEKSKNRHFPKNKKIRNSRVGGNGRSPFNNQVRRQCLHHRQTTFSQERELSLDNHTKWTHVARNELRIGLFESHNHFQPIATPPRPPIPLENSPNRHFPKDPKI